MNHNETFFTVTNEDLARLSPEGAVDRFRDLLWAEASRLGIGPALVDVPSAITTPDGGIDAEITGVSVSSSSGLIKVGTTRYQIKTGDFNLSQDSHVNEILFGPSKPGKKKVLLPRVQSCLDAGGTFVAVLFGWDGPGTKDDVLVEKFREVLGGVDPKYRNAKVEILRQNNLRGLFEQFPSLSLRLNRNDTIGFQSHQSWAKNQDMTRAITMGSEQIELVARIRQELRKSGAAVHVRILGEPGVGKTRLVLEATDEPDLRPLVIYCDSPARLWSGGLVDRLAREDNNQRVILIVDECDAPSRARIWNFLCTRGDRIKLVTIHNEYESASGIPYFDVPLLAKDDVQRIISGYGISMDQTERWADLCSGSPRVAHVIGENLKSNPDDLLRPAANVDVWERFITGTDVAHSRPVAQRRVVLRHLALFKKFGYGDPLAEEAKRIADLVEGTDPSITWNRFQEIIRELRARRILQGETTLYLTPKALHIFLWTEWWETYGHGFEADDFYGRISEQLREWFNEMFRYAASSAVASRVVADLLAPQGPFSDGEILKTRDGASFFSALSEADPGRALSLLERTVGEWSPEEIGHFTVGRREVIWALERITVWRQHFLRGARLLRHLASGENETYSNNSAGVFSDLFSLAPGRVAPTEASPDERFPVLEETLRSASPVLQRLGIEAARSALRTGPFERMVGAEQQGLKVEPQLWWPRTHGEIFTAYRNTWNLLEASLDALGENERRRAVVVLLESSWGLLRVEDLSDMVLMSLDRLSRRQDVDRNEILAAILRILRHERGDISGEVVERLRLLEHDITGDDFSSRLHRYVGTGFSEDFIDKSGNLVDAKEEPLRTLAAEAVSELPALRRELPWLVSDAAKDGFRFGYQLARIDTGFSLLDEIVSAQRESGKIADLLFLGGYLRVVAEERPETWERVLDDLSSSPATAGWIVDLTWRSNRLSQQASERLLGLVESGVIPRENLAAFAVGSCVRQLGEDEFVRWLGLFLEDEDGAASVALDLYQRYTFDAERLLPNAVLLRLLLHPSWFMPIQGEALRRSSQDFAWCSLAEAITKANPADCLAIAIAIIDHVGDDDTIFERSERVNAILTAITEQHPRELWDRVKEHLASHSPQAFHLQQWLGGGFGFHETNTGALELIPPELVWAWVAEDVENRAWLVASFVPQDLGRPASMARELLLRYGDRKDVREALHSNYGTGGWVGPESQYVERRRDATQLLLDGEDHHQVRVWLQERLDQLNRRLEAARIREERRGY